MKRSMQVLLAILLGFLIISSTSCLQPVEDPKLVLIGQDESSSEVIPADQGGVITLPSGATLSILPGAIPEEKMVTFTTTDVSGRPEFAGKAIGKTYEVTGFSEPLKVPARISLRYNPAQLDGADPKGLLLVRNDGQGWTALTSELDEVNYTLSASTDHFSFFRILDWASILLTYGDSVTLPAPTGWYPGTPHVHTNYSDGFSTVWGVGELAKKQGLAWVGLSDHGYIDFRVVVKGTGISLIKKRLGDEAWRKRSEEVKKAGNGIVFLEGEELSTNFGLTSKDSHLVAFGINSPIADFSTDEPPIRLYGGQKLIDTVTNSGGFSFVAHPFLKIYPWFENWPDASGFSGLEILDASRKIPGEDELNRWNELLKKSATNNSSSYVSASGGADFHALPYDVLDPSARESLLLKGILPFVPQSLFEWIYPEGFVAKDFQPITYLNVEGELTSQSAEWALRTGRAVSSIRGSFVNLEINQPGGPVFGVGESLAIDPARDLNLTVSWKGLDGFNLNEMKLVAVNGSATGIIATEEIVPTEREGQRTITLKPSDAAYPQSATFIRVQSFFTGSLAEMDWATTNPILVSPQWVTGADSATALVFDVSGTMGETWQEGVKIESAQKAGTKLVSMIDSENKASQLNHQVAIASFSDQASLIEGLTSTIPVALSAISRLAPQDRTNLGEGLDIAMTELQKAAPGKQRIIILLSDGLNNVGYTNQQILADLLPRAKQLGIRVYTVGFGERGGSIDEKFLQQIANSTGGSYQYAGSGYDLSNVYVALRQRSLGFQVLNKSGEIRQGEVLPIQPFVILGQKDLFASLNWPGSTVSLQLIDPQGKPVDDQYPGASITAGPPTYVIIRNALNGVWRATVTGKEVSGASEPFEVMVSERAASTVPTNSAAQVLILVLLLGGCGAILFLFLRKKPIPVLVPVSKAVAGGSWTLVWHDPNGEAHQTDLSTGALSIGRLPSCSVSFPSDPTISRTHSRILLTQQGPRIIDMQSKNGTFVNQERTKDRLLRHGDRIRAGKQSFTLYFHQPRRH